MEEEEEGMGDEGKSNDGFSQPNISHQLPISLDRAGTMGHVTKNGWQ